MIAGIVAIGFTSSTFAGFDHIAQLRKMIFDIMPAGESPRHGGRFHGRSRHRVMLAVLVMLLAPQVIHPVKALRADVSPLAIG
jgi:hypothetical protein